MARSPASRISPPGSIRACSTAARSRASPAPARSTRIVPDRAGAVRRGRDHPRPRRQRRRRARQRAGGAVRRRRHAGVAPIRLPRDASWTLAQRMAAERDASASISRPTRSTRRRHLARRAQGQELRRTGGDAGARPTAAARRDDGRAGRGSALADLGQGPPLHDGDARAIPRANMSRPRSTTSRAPRSRPRSRSGGCGLMTVELDRRPGDEAPRVTVKRFQPLGCAGQAHAPRDDRPRPRRRRRRCAWRAS